jgi:broad specificity phosphatase PhoE
VRHGHTALNTEGRLRGRLDPPLDEIGLSEAAAVALAAISERSLAVLEAQLPILDHGDLVLVSHDAVNKALLTLLDPDLASTVRQRTGCWNEIRRNRDRWMVTLANQQPTLADATGGADQ